MPIQTGKMKGTASEQVQSQKQTKKSKGCLGRSFKAIIWLLALFAIIGILGQNKKSQKTESTVPTATVTATATVMATKASATETPTKDPEKEEIVLHYPDLGEYGRYYTMNGSVEKATDEDKETIIQCFVPAGDYLVINETKYPRYVNVYSEKTIITDMGWEEAADGYVSEQMQPGGSCKITIKEGYYIKLMDNTTFRLIREE